jgi:hypothetical protein
MKHSGLRGSFAGVACAALLINALLPAAVCVGLFDASRGPASLSLCNAAPAREPLGKTGLLCTPAPCACCRSGSRLCGEAIAEGRQPPDLTMMGLTRRVDLPWLWSAQEEVLGIR